ncbi:Eco57I restriction-modification methylase domain-containing protein [Gillisia sp. JM1]|uniref:type IIG restriction enzyme/methyltransferase n=1 Tax=Gillisia sp. JM1 TaxID=1283286 RepID=UPI000400C893|nr:TaqI-like C-terminal specificity domain-containing protein [Gillisia sp. JM1]
MIHNGNKAGSTVGVIIEAKKPTNRAEMLSKEKVNVKAFQELVLYYLRERITQKNLEVKYLIATNINEWFIFDANIFEKAFAQNKRLVSQFIDFEAGRLAGKTTDFFYKEIAEPFIAEMQQEVEFTHFDIRNYEKPLRNNNPKDDNKLIALFKLLSPEHLLKLPFTNDSNSLDKRFYGELLHIIGLTETKQGGKKLIERQKEGNRNTGSFLENAIIQLESMDKIGQLSNPSHFGDTHQERLFNVGLELSITWLNRILFLKLLEAQLLTYQKGDKTYEFLSLDRIHNYDDLNSLFFQVLAQKHSERNGDVKALFEKVPYLNSSLFEPTDIEHATLFISNLRDDKMLPIYSATVLKDKKGKKRSGELNALEYLFEFLNSYDFSSEGGESIQEDNKTLINASVLGLIFEKINGYKDGSFFTPGFITMYMCRETIRKAVVQKFNETKSWECKDLEELYDRIEDRKEANTIINSLKICDPAVGSGHFLVSALNEIIAIKNDLNILQDRSGRRLKEYQVEVVNDELIVTDEEGELFEYNPSAKESQRIQEALFHEKQQIIENCLFGVDINPNSVKICRLRLWIELLKNTYYKWENDTSPFGGGREGELETLPNIDINIKCGNSLISRFDLDADLSKALKDSKWNIDSYRVAVDTYRNAENKEQKREMEKIIHDIKNDFRSEISSNDPKVKKLQKVKGELFLLTNQTQMFEMSKREKATWNKKLEKLSKDSKKLETEIQEIKDNKIYENAFEWRFEFPEVLNEEGDYLGFDVVIGNPPYVFSRDNLDTTSKNYFYSNYEGIDYQVNLYVLFAELTLKILTKRGMYGLIVPNTLLMVSSTEKIRRLLFNNASITEVVNFLGESFEGVSVETISYFGLKGKSLPVIKVSVGENGVIKYLHDKKTETVLKSDDLIMNVFSSDTTDEFLLKLKEGSDLLDDLVEIKAGLQAYEVGKGIPVQSREDVTNRIYDYDHKFDKMTFPYLEGKDVDRYICHENSSYLKYGENLAASRSFEIFSNPKIIIREITGQHPYSLLASYTEETVLFNRSNIAINSKEGSNINLKFILALINSKLISYYFQLNTAKAVRRLFPKIILKDLRKFPIKKGTAVEQNIIAETANQILMLKTENTAADTSFLEAEIDSLVYELYGLTEEEIGIIEGSVG